MDSETLPLAMYTYAGNKFVAAATYDHNIASEGGDWIYLAYHLTNHAFDGVRDDDRFREFQTKVRELVKENGCTDMLEEWLSE